MTEFDWLASSNCAAMLRHVEGLVSDRKLRLFEAACYRDIVAEEARANTQPFQRQRWCQLFAENGKPAFGARYHRGKRTLVEIGIDQCNLLRTIVGNPFRPVVTPPPEPASIFVALAVLAREADHPERRYLNPGLLAWRDGIIPKLANDIYDRRDWASMKTVLPDALEEAGCDIEEIVRWCRGEERCPDRDCRDGRWHDCEGVSFSCDTCLGTGWIPRRGPSVRGDWVIDLLTGRS